MTDTKPANPRALIEGYKDRNAPVEVRASKLRTLLTLRKDDIVKAAAGMMSFERMIAQLLQYTYTNSAVLGCEPASIIGAMCEAALHKWVVDGVLGHAYIVPFNRNVGTRDKPHWISEAKLIPGYKGLRELVERSGQCRISMESVHQGDEFEFIDRWEKPRHKYSNNPRRRSLPLTHAYVVARFNDGSYMCWVMTKDECLAHRDHFSQGYRKARDKDSENWDEKSPNFRTMCMKTVLRDVINRGELPMSIEDERTQELLHRAIAPDAADIGSPTPKIIESTFVDLSDQAIEPPQAPPTPPAEPEKKPRGRKPKAESPQQQAPPPADAPVEGEPTPPPDESELRETGTLFDKGHDTPF